MAAHRVFLEAGADIISTNSYNASFEIFTNANVFTGGMLPGGSISKEASQLRFTNDVLRASVELAKKARDDFWRELTAADPTTARLRPLVAASIGPVGDNVTPWTGATDPLRAVHEVDDGVSALYYRRKVVSLSKSMPDFLALETLPGLHEARIALAALAAAEPDLSKHGLRVPPCWVSFICTSETSTAAGDDFADAVAELSLHPAVAGVGVNCTAPQLVQPLLRRARAAAPNAHLLAYPNSGEVWDSEEHQRCWHGHAHTLTGADALAMREAGANAIGGCCRVSGDEIVDFRQALV